MPIFIVSGSKQMRDGNVHVVAETAHSITRAEWIRAHYVEAGYTVHMEMQNSKTGEEDISV